MAESDDSQYQYRKDIHAQYMNDRSILLERDFSLTMHLNKSLLAVSSGALVLSMTLVKQVFGAPIEINYLAVSWVCFGTTILILLLGTWFGSFSHQRQLKNYNELYLDFLKENGKKRDTPRNPWSKPIVICDVLVVVSFLSGCITLGFFVYMNLTKGL